MRYVDRKRLCRVGEKSHARETLISNRMTPAKTLSDSGKGT